MIKASLAQRLKAKCLQLYGFTLLTRADVLRKDLELIPDLIGRSAASNALSHYLLNFDKLSSDKQLSDFMNFYANHFSESKSQWSQDVWVMYETQGLSNGCYLEVGGADGFTHSNTLSLELYYGWKGTLVEPESNQFANLQMSRPGNTLLNCALSPSGEFETVTLRSVGQLSSLMGFENRDVHSDHRLLSRKLQCSNAIPLEFLLSQRRYDYFSLDIEGAELEVLESVRWDSVFKPQLLTVEHNSRYKAKDDLISFLHHIGYVPSFYEHSWLLQGDLWFKLVR